MQNQTSDKAYTVAAIVCILLIIFFIFNIFRQTAAAPDSETPAASASEKNPDKNSTSTPSRDESGDIGKAAAIVYNCGQDFPDPQNPGWCRDEVGKASWYDYALAGDPDYSKTHATAASRHYKRGTKLQVCTVESIETMKCVEVQVNDYGPSAAVFPDRVLDLSSYAFSQLEPLSRGVIYVDISELR